jgi:hypothetical protein
MKSVILKGILCCILFNPLINAGAQVAAVHFTVYVPALSDQDKGVYITGSFNYWHAGDSLYRMHKTGEDLYSITLPLFDNEQYEYKYTLGNWNRVEVSSSDSDIHNRMFFSADGKDITDTVMKWKQPQSAANNSNPQLQKMNAMKDSVLASLKPSLNDMQQLLKAYVQNMLKEKPSARIQRRLDKKAEKKLDYAYEQITKLIWNVMAMLSPEQKQMIQKALNSPAGKNDFLNTFTGSLNAAMAENIPAQ